MAKDDYHVIVYKVLVYLYAILKGKEMFEQIRYDKAIGRKSINEDYLFRVYKMMSDEGLIEELTFTKAWGNDIIPMFDEKDMRITTKGIDYIEQNDKMKEIGKILAEKVDTIAKLAIEAGLSHIMR